MARDASNALVGPAPQLLYSHPPFPCRLMLPSQRHASELGGSSKTTRQSPGTLLMLASELMLACMEFFSTKKEQKYGPTES